MTETASRWTPTVRGSNGAVPRAFESHNSRDGRAYGKYVRALRARLGALPPAADILLREVGKLSVELQHLSRDLEEARRRGRKQDASRVSRQQFRMRGQLGKLEERLASYADDRNRKRGPSLADVMSGGGE